MKMRRNKCRCVYLCELATNPKQLMSIVMVLCLIMFCVNNVVFMFRTNQEFRDKVSHTYGQGILNAAIFQKARPEKNADPFDLCLATSWTRKHQKGKVHEVVVKNWAEISSRVKPVLFSLEEKVRNAVWSPYWTVLSEVESSLETVPTIRGIMNKIMDLYPSKLYGFANGDLIFASNFWKSIQVILNDYQNSDKPLLILGKRLNVNFDPLANYSKDSLSYIGRTYGRYPIDGSSDIFITNKLFPWSKIPKIVIGRMGIGMWLVGYARARNVTIIDATATSTILHLTTNIGIHESGYAKNFSFNIDLLNKLGYGAEHYQTGSLDCVNMVTRYEQGRIIITKRKISPSCTTDFLNIFHDFSEDEHL